MSQFPGFPSSNRARLDAGITFNQSSQQEPPDPQAIVPLLYSDTTSLSLLSKNMRSAQHLMSNGDINQTMSHLNGVQQSINQIEIVSAQKLVLISSLLGQYTTQMQNHIHDSINASVKSQGTEISSQLEQELLSDTTLIERIQQIRQRCNATNKRVLEFIQRTRDSDFYIPSFADESDVDDDEGEQEQTEQKQEDKEQEQDERTE